MAHFPYVPWLIFYMCHDSFSICAMTHFPYVPLLIFYMCRDSLSNHIWMTMWCVKYGRLAPHTFRLCHDSLSMCAVTHFPYVLWLIFHNCCTDFTARLSVVVGFTIWVTAHMCKYKCGRGMYYRCTIVHPVTPDSRGGRGMSYGVATVSRIDKIIGLFCKRAL